MLALVLVGIVVTEIVRPKPLDWRPSYTATATTPFGCYVLFNELGQLFPQEHIVSVNNSVYETLAYRDSQKHSSYIFINNTVGFDPEETRELLDYVSDGNEIFIAATSFGAVLSDTLKIEMKSFYTVKEDTVTLGLTNKAFSKDRFYYTRGLYKTHFRNVDTLNTIILGHLSYSEEGNFLEQESNTVEKKTEANFIKVRFGKGYFYLNATPQAYTNYYMLGANKDYVGHTLSYLGDKPVYWDNYEKSGRIVINSPLRFVLNQVSLKWAYYLCIMGVLLFLIFKAKRQQRIIPVITPLQNASVAFARTVGSLYYQHKDYTDLIGKKINFFLEFVRSHYFLDSNSLNEQNARQLAAKSGKPLAQTKALIELIGHLKNKRNHSEQDLLELTKQITLFKKQ